MKKVNSKPSPETVVEALKVARATQKVGQTKEQTKLIAQGIEKGIEQYKKQEKAKARAADKAKKRSAKKLSTDKSSFSQAPIESALNQKYNNTCQYLPWILLAVSWLSFITYAIYF